MCGAAFAPPKNGSRRQQRTVSDTEVHQGVQSTHNLQFDSALLELETTRTKLRAERESKARLSMELQTARAQLPEVEQVLSFNFFHFVVF